MKLGPGPKQPLTRGSSGRIERGKVRRVSQEKGRGS